MTASSQDSLGFIPTGLGIGIILTGYFFLSCTGIDNNSSNSYLQREKLFVAISGISYLTLLEEEHSDKRTNEFLESCSYMGILSGILR